MNNFSYHNPVRIEFGKDSIQKLAELIPATKKKILLLYGGGSIKKNGIYEQVRQALSGRDVLDFGGIEANPRYETCLKAVDLIKEHKVDFLLSVGGGSVLDATKFIAAAVCYTHSKDLWEILQTTGTYVDDALVLGCVLTLPATGSEMNATAVISRESSDEKLFFFSPLVYPTFSVLDPVTTFSLPVRQTANGIVDAFVHTLEQYLTVSGNCPLQDRQAESILCTLVEEAPKVAADPEDYSARANIMWCATQALNGVIGLGTQSDWASHGIGHELTAFYGIDHGQSLAIVWPGVARFRLDDKKEKLLRFGKRVWGLEGEDSEIAELAIVCTEDFFEKVGCPVSLSSYGVDAEEAGRRIRTRFEERALIGLGEGEKITPAMVEEIVKSRA